MPLRLLAHPYRWSLAWRRRIEAARVRLPDGPGAFDPAAVRRALLVCTGLLGDSVMCLPSIASARRLLPNAEVLALVTEPNRRFLELTNCIDGFLLADCTPLGFRGEARRRARALEQSVSTRGVDLAIILLGDDYAPMLTRARIRHRVFVREAHFAGLGTATYTIGSARTWGPEERLNAWRVLGLSPRLEYPEIHPLPESTRAIDALVGRTVGPLVVVHPFGRTADQWWPMESVSRLARALGDRLKATTVVVGGPAEARLMSSRNVEGSYCDAVGRLSVAELCALFARASVVVSTDSGPFHLAGAMGRAGVGLFRATRPEHACHYPSMAALVAPSVAECHALCRWDHCAHQPCREMERLSAEAVLEAVIRKAGEGARRDSLA